MGGLETILLTEDDDSVRSFIKGVLEQAGYKVITASDGAKALELFSQYKGKTDLLLLDVVMPEMGGHELMTSVREIDDQVSILFMSGYSADGIHTNFILQENLELVQKPFHTSSLLRKIRTILDRSQHTSAR